jgi:hypothetical protein
VQAQPRQQQPLPQVTGGMQQQQLLQQVAVGQTGMGGVLRAGETGEMIVQAQPHQQQPLPQVTGGMQQQQLLQQVAVGQTGMGGVLRAGETGEMIVHDDNEDIRSSESKGEVSIFGSLLYT